MKPHFRSSPLAGLLLLASLGAAGAAMAEPAPPFAALLAQAQASAPRLAEARANIARAEGLARQAGVLPNPTLEFEVENFSGSGPFRGTSLSETTARVGQTLELGGKRSARVAAGRAEIDAARAQARRVEAEYAFDLAAAYAEAEAAERRLQLARESLTLAEEDARIASALVDAGREAELRRLQAQAAVEAARAAVQAAQAARETAFGALTTLAGAPAPITSIPASLLESAAPLFPGAAPAASATTSYLAAQAEREAAARRLRVERRRAVPDVTVSIGVRRFEADDAAALVAGVSVPLPLFDQNRGNIAAARAEAAAAEARLNAARLEAESAVRTSAARSAAAESRLSAARQGESTAHEAYRLARIGYEAGRLPLAELVAARRALAEAREQTIAAAVERISAQAAIARLSVVATPGEQ
ncbi:metal ion efflux outer membrane factor protein family [Phenylobacterium zucineum HLK1]|uniref:Metal ion efflux outer membrane factor protein family n=1 Tax=Phenylobacterium zucineum (strain HLK1) TaxID=450851 RepID=B4R9T0_PHEZH|nr:TolC family protein [Phenylobacterium zucineum]ACG77844.1 metal ion efflux outer membrane factor protein family [Phenylobacterium zucineum HLK1]